jgi:hypothetical protein
VAAIVTIAIAVFGSSVSPAVPPDWDGPRTPDALAPSIYETIIDGRPVSFTLTVNWHKVGLTSTMERLSSDPFLWRNMHFDDWDRVPPALRGGALDGMLSRYAGALGGPDVWAQLTAADWDVVPQPVRAVVFPRMAAHWARVYGLTNIYALSPDLVVDTLASVMMAESWFEHRGVNVNAWGNRDIGLGGCSDHCRRTLAAMATSGDLDFSLTEEDYFNPWHATRAMVVWFGLELVRAGGDLDLAIRAYHRGFPSAMDAKGDAYLANVQRLRTRYFRGSIASPTWRTVQAWAAGVSSRA